MSEQQPIEETATAVPDCPKCQGPMWDNRVGKRNPKAPDFKCKDKECDGVVWPPRDSASLAPAAVANAGGGASSAAGAPAGKAPQGGGLSSDGMPLCPICGGAMWDDRLSKRNPKAPDFKCRNKPKERGGPGCEGIIWPPRDGVSPYPQSGARKSSGGTSMSAPPKDAAPPHDEPPPFDDAPPFDDDDLPF